MPFRPRPSPRSYALHERERARKMDRHYDVVSTTQDQVYAGATELDVAHQATRTTRGLVLSDRGELLRAYYSSTCGGRPASAADTFPTGAAYRFNKARPIQAQKRAHFCGDSPRYRWSVTRDADELTARVKQFARERSRPDLATIATIGSIRVLTENKAGRPAIYRLVDVNGKAVGSDLVSYWFADGTNYPGQDDIRARKRRFERSLRTSYEALAPEQTMLLEYKPFEPAFYHTDIADWGMSYAMCLKLGKQAKVLVDTGHHYNAQNVEQIVAWLLDEEMLGGFHFNDRRYADLTLGSIDPYQIFRIFNEIHGYAAESGSYPNIAYMVDQSHNLKPKMEAMIQTVMTAQDLWAKAAMVDREALALRQRNGAIVDAENLLKAAFNADAAPLLAQWRQSKGLSENPLAAYRESGYAEQIEKERVQRRADLGVSQASSYA